MQDVQGRVAVVTGAASGIGRGMCEAFVDAGMRVVLADVEEQALERTTGQLRARGADVHAVVTDVSKPEQVEALAAETLRHYGAVHVVCNNAGVGTETVPSWSGTLDDWNWVLGVNLMGVIHGVRTFLPILIDQGDGGHIVNTASLAGLVTGGNTPYAVSEVRRGGAVGRRVPRAQAGRLPAQHLGPVSGIREHEHPRRCAATDRRSWPRPREPMTGPVADVFREWFTEQLRQGLDPRRVGDQVLAAIRDDRFYILTHPEWNGLIEHRMRAILAGDNPTAVPPPGFEVAAAEAGGARGGDVAAAGPASSRAHVATALCADPVSVAGVEHLAPIRVTMRPCDHPFPRVRPDPRARPRPSGTWATPGRRRSRPRPSRWSWPAAT